MIGNRTMPGVTYVEGKTLEHVYDEIIRKTWTMGYRSRDQRGNHTRTLCPVVTHITGTTNDYPSFGPTDIKFGIDFADGLTRASIALQKAENFDYAYGERIRRNNAYINIIHTLRNARESRGCVLPIYMPEDTLQVLNRARNLEHREVPCMTQMILTPQRNKLHMMITMRSNDMVGAYPADVYGSRALQARIARETHFEVGHFTHVVMSGHIIEENDAQFMEKHLKTPLKRKQS